ncbi:MAG: di-heme oxidoredictase family protein [Bacteroidota bacterium]
MAPQLPGLGLLESIPASAILGQEDPNDSDQDGISGRANQVWDVKTQSVQLGRFGWKATQPTVEQQNAGAFNGDMGLTSNIFPEDEFSEAQELLYPDIINGGEPEVTDQQIQRITLYVKSLSVPAKRNTDLPEYFEGRFLFNTLKCNSCHTPSYITQDGNDIPSLDRQNIYPYTDLLLHDMGEGLADNRSDFLANGREWRTPPLWGIGLIPVVNDHSRLLHDGRARNIEEAILWHGGEAEQSKEEFKKLTKEEREALLLFLESI